VTKIVPPRYRQEPAKRSQAAGSDQERSAPSASSEQPSAVPSSTPKNQRFSTTTLMDCMARTPCAGRRRAKAGITKLEKPKKTPAISPQPSAASRVMNSVMACSLDRA